MILERLENIERKIDISNIATNQPSYRGVGVSYSAQASMKYEVSGTQYDFTTMDELESNLAGATEIKIYLYRWVPETKAEDSFSPDELRHTIHSNHTLIGEHVNLILRQPNIKPENQQRSLMGKVHSLSITQDDYTPAKSKKKPKTEKFSQPRVFVSWFEKY